MDQRATPRDSTPPRGITQFSNFVKICKKVNISSIKFFFHLKS